MLLPFLKNEYLSIDIGFRNIKIVEVSVSRNNNVFVKNFGIAATPRHCIKNGVIKDIDKVSSEISRVIKNNSMKLKKAKIVMSGTSIISRVFMIDRVMDEDLDSLIKYTISQNMPINTEEHRIDYKILQEYKEQDRSKVKVFVTAVRKSIISSYIDVLFSLGLKPISVDIPANSTAKFFNRDIKVVKEESWMKKQKHKNYNKDVFAVLDFGSETTIVNILRNRILEFNKVILSGSTNIDTAISNQLQVHIDEAERFKKMYGLSKPGPNSGREQEGIHKAVKGVVDTVINQIITCFNFYETRCYGARVGGIYIIGGGSLLKGLGEYMEDVLDTPVYPVGLLDIDGIELNKKLDRERLNFLVNSVGITL